MFKRKKKIFFSKSHCTRKKINNNKDKKKVVRDNNVNLSNIHENTKSKQYYKKEMKN